MKPEQTCGNCKWWGEVSENADRCVCKHPKCNESKSADGFGVDGGEPFNGGVFVTGKDFGCVHFTDRFEKSRKAFGALRLFTVSQNKK